MDYMQNPVLQEKFKYLQCSFCQTFFVFGMYVHNRCSWTEPLMAAGKFEIFWLKGVGEINNSNFLQHLCKLLCCIQNGAIWQISLIDAL